MAAGTSLPDAYVSVMVARRNEGVVGRTNVRGSNIFDLLLGILIAGTSPIDFTVAVLMMDFLTLATIMLFTMMRTSSGFANPNAGVCRVCKSSSLPDGAGNCGSAECGTLSKSW
ncbi:MAG: hypothetical protein ACLFQO_15560 [Cyclobacteriaceae bacterium]